LLHVPSRGGDHRDSFEALTEFGIKANIPINPRNASAQECDEYFDDALCKKRTGLLVIEHTFAR
jgi:hypothetical protein